MATAMASHDHPSQEAKDVISHAFLFGPKELATLRTKWAGDLSEEFVKAAEAC